MKMFIFSLILVGIVGVISAALLGGKETFALSGCCKVKNSAGQWQVRDDSLKSCRKRNQSEGDNIFEPKGKVWWDVNC